MNDHERDTDAARPRTVRDGRFVLVRELGGGAQARTWEAVDKRIGQAVVVKVFHVRGAETWKEVELAEREAKVLQTVEHELCPRYVDHFEEAGALYLVMSRIEGTSVKELAKRGAFTPEDVVDFLFDVADILGYLHARLPPLIHRDIKPSNVVRRSDGRYCLIDFGSVRDSLKPEGGSTVVGTFGYMAPEQFQGRAMPASDLYSVGATALFMISGREPDQLPHVGLGIDVRRVLGGRPGTQPLRLLERLLAPDPDRRPASLKELLELYQPRRASGTPPPHAAAHPSSPPGTENAPGGFAPERPDTHWEPPFPFRTALYVFISVGLVVARIAVFFGLRHLAPLVLRILAPFVNPRLRYAARRARSIGKVVLDELDEAQRTVTKDLGPEGFDPTSRAFGKKRNSPRPGVVDTTGEPIPDDGDVLDQDRHDAGDEARHDKPSRRR